MVAACGEYQSVDSKKRLLEQISDGKGCKLFPACMIKSAYYRCALRGETLKQFEWGEDVAFLRFADALVGLYS